MVYEIRTIETISIRLLLLILTVESVEEGTFLAGEDNYILCTGHAETDDTYVWTDVSVTPNIRIYTVNDNITKTEEAKQIGKYDNFLIENHFPDATSLLFRDVELEDRGTYSCELLLETVVVLNYRVVVEVGPANLLLSCLGIDECPPPPPDNDPSKVDCVCTAAGVFPQLLQFLGNGLPTKHKIVDKSLTGPEGSNDISSDFIVYPTPTNDVFQCMLTGFKNTVSNMRITAPYTFRPPICNLEIITHVGCLSASLACVCKNAAPGIAVYNFYNETKTMIGLPQTHHIKNVSIQTNERMVFYCRGCNGVNFGSQSFAENTVQCHKQQSTAKPSTNTSPKVTQETDDQNLGLILGLTFGLALLITVTAIFVGLITARRRKVTARSGENLISLSS